MAKWITLLGLCATIPVHAMSERYDMGQLPPHALINHLDLGQLLLPTEREAGFGLLQLVPVNHCVYPCQFGQD